MNFIYAVATDVGVKRSQNQDNHFVDPRLGLFLVADGMGGYQGGEIASQFAVDFISRSVAGESGEVWDSRMILGEALWKANDAIYRKAQEDDRKLANMGTTVTALLFKKNLLTLGHVGDSRGYFLLPDRIWPLTRDHSYVEEKIRAGIITREQAKEDPLKNIITRSVGYEENLVPEYFEIRVRRNDLFMICSDGLSSYVSEDEILKTLNEILPQDRQQVTEEHLKKAVSKLIEKANNLGGDDNVTVIMIKVESPDFL